MTQGLISLTEEHEMIHQAARDLTQKEITPIAAEFDETGEVPIVQPQALRQRVNELEQRVASLEADLGRTGESRPAAALNWRLIIFFAATVVLAVIPPLLVIQDRWWKGQFLSDTFGHWWYQLGLESKLSLPPYFLGIFACILLVLVLVLLNREGPLVIFSNLGIGETQASSTPVSEDQRRVSRILLAVAGVGIGIIFLRTLFSQTIPGLELALVLMVYILGWAVREIPLESITRWWQEQRDLIFAVLLVHLALIAFLINSFAKGTFLWVFAILLALAALNLIRYIRKVPVTFWIINLAMILFTINLNAWWFSVIGDEYNFYNYAREIAERQTLPFISENLFNGLGVYGTHPYLSSLIQAIFMKLLGVGGFGWRFSNVYLSALAIGLFYHFFKAFTPKRVALVAALLLAVSEYIMSFSKIGYNNLQSFFAMSVVLWAVAWAIQSRRSLAYVTLGLGMGFCFYVYPAALYVVPLPLLLMLFFDPPKSKVALLRWGLVSLSGLVIIFPLLFQPIYWQAKEVGTLFNNPEITASSAALIRHLTTNLVYAPLSFLYIVEETHFVASSYVDPLTGALILIGFSYWLKGIRKTHFAQFWLIGFAVIVFLAGVTHDRQFPAVTRMFLLLPFYALFAAAGLLWLQQQLVQIHGGQWSATIVPLVIVAVIGLNLYQAFPLSLQRMAQYQSLETIFLRTALRGEQVKPEIPKTYIFITATDWSIEGIKLLQTVYGVPDSAAQLVRIPVTQQDIDSSNTIPDPGRALIADPNAMVIIQPWINETWQAPLKEALQEMGKTPCDVVTVQGNVSFELWYSGDLAEICK